MASGCDRVANSPTPMQSTRPPSKISTLPGAQGFMSAMNAEAIAHSRPFRLIEGRQAAAHKLAIRSYCDAHPLAQYAQAVVDLYNSLPPSR
jgi:hypothetical protein